MGLGESKIQRPNGARQAEPQERTGEQAGSGQLLSVARVPGVQDGVTGTDGEQLVKEGQLESSKKVTPADEEERQNVEIVKEGERQKVKIATEADNGSSQKATPANEEEKQSLNVLEHESQEYGSRSTTNVDTEASGSTDRSRGQPAGYDPWAALKLSIEKKAAANEIETLKKRNKELEEQIARAKSQNSRAHSAHGVYSRSEADPGLLQTVATAIKQSLTSFTDILTERMKSEPGLKADFHPTGVKFKRGVDIKFAIHAELCSLVFQGLWVTDEYFFYRCLPEYAVLGISCQLKLQPSYK